MSPATQTGQGTRNPDAMKEYTMLKAADTELIMAPDQNKEGSSCKICPARHSGGPRGMYNSHHVVTNNHQDQACFAGQVEARRIRTI